MGKCKPFGKGKISNLRGENINHLRRGPYQPSCRGKIRNKMKDEYWGKLRCKSSMYVITGKNTGERTY
jgi:hypothetical protein